jgi:hypothetical protein
MERFRGGAKDMPYPVKLVIGMAHVFVSGGWLWRITMAAYGFVVVVGGGATTTTPGRAMLSELGFPELGPWQFGTIVAVVGLLFFAGRVSFYETARLRLDGLMRHHDGHGVYYIRAIVINSSIKDAEKRLVARLDAVSPAPRDAKQTLSFPLNLPTHERLRSFLSSGTPIPHSRFTIMAGEPKKIEIFHLIPQWSQICITHENGTEKFAVLNFHLDFVVSGHGAPLKFSVWVFWSDDGIQTRLIRDDFDKLVFSQMSIDEWMGK